LKKNRTNSPENKSAIYSFNLKIQVDSVFPWRFRGYIKFPAGFADSGFGGQPQCVVRFYYISPSTFCHHFVIILSSYIFPAFFPGRAIKNAPSFLTSNPRRFLSRRKL